MIRTESTARPRRLRAAAVRGASRAAGMLRLVPASTPRLPSARAMSAWAGRAGATLAELP